MNVELSGNIATINVRCMCNDEVKVNVYLNGTTYVGDALCTYAWTPDGTYIFNFTNPYQEVASFDFYLMADGEQMAVSQSVLLNGN